MKKSIVPWRTPEQFMKVYEYVYSDNLTKYRWAVDQMAVWETRCWPTLPTAVEATLLLAGSKIQDMLFEAGKTLCHAREIEMMYATAIIRFVNLILESHQNTIGRIKLTALAEMENIPAWIIDIRHNLTHGHSPTLPVLRMAYKCIMEYLESTFWAPELERLKSMIKTFDGNSMIKVIQQYRAIQYQRVLNKFDKKSTIFTKVCREILFFLRDPKTRKQFLKILVHPDNFVKQNDIRLALTEDKDFADEDLKNSAHKSLPKILQEFWSPMLRFIHKYNSIPTFIELLQLSQKNRKIKVFQKIVDFVVLYIIDLTSPSAVNSSLRTAFIRKGPLIDYRRLLYSCMIGCSSYSWVVFEKISKKVELGNWKEELSVMMSIKQGFTISKESECGRKNSSGAQKRKFDMTFTVDDLEEDILMEVAKRNPQLKNNHWSYAPISKDFSNDPLGHVYNPVEKEIKEESKHEMETNSQDESSFVLKNEKTEDSMPVVIPKLENFIFQRLPAESYMIYRRRDKK